MGGQDEKTQPGSQFVVYNAEYDKVLSINKYQVPSGLGFNNCSVCVFNRKVYALQTIMSKNGDTETRNILLFDGYKWRIIWYCVIKYCWFWLMYKQQSISMDYCLSWANRGQLKKLHLPDSFSEVLENQLTITVIQIRSLRKCGSVGGSMS